MAIQFNCPSCGQPIEVDDALGGKEVGCPFCSQTVAAPGQSMLDTRPPSVSPAESALPTPVGVKQGNPLSWISLGCVAVSIIAWIVFMGYLAPIIQKLPDPGDQEAVRKAFEEEFAGGAGVMLVSLLAACTLQLAGLVCGIIALVKKSPPRWPAIAALCIMGGSVLLLCVLSAVGS